MITKITAYEAADGSLHRTEDAALIATIAYALGECAEIVDFTSHLDRVMLARHAQALMNVLWDSGIRPEEIRSGISAIKADIADNRCACQGDSSVGAEESSVFWQRTAKAALKILGVQEKE